MVQIRQGGTWQDATPHVRVAGGWQEVKEMFARQGGAWHSVWTGTFGATITTNQTNLNLRTWALANGWDGSSAAKITINSGVVISGSVAANSTAALTIDGSWPGGVTLINNGSIIGRGGDGGKGNNAYGSHWWDEDWGDEVYTYCYLGTAATAGGRALTASVACTIQNNGSILGGGGGGSNAEAGGGGRGHAAGSEYAGSSGAGGGGGRSGNINSAGGAKGTATASGRSQGGSTWSTNLREGGAGAAGTLSAAGAAGFRASTASLSNVSARGGTASAGGNYGAAGAAQVNDATGTTTFGNTCHHGVNRGSGAAGQAVNGNSNITWTATGTRTGPIV